jgi:zinc transporter
MTDVQGDDRGLICAFDLGPARVAPVGADALDGAATTAGPPRWLHLNLTDTRARRWVEQQGRIHHDAREILLSADNRVQSQAVAGGLTMVLADLHHDLKGSPERIGMLSVYVDEHLMITGRRHALQSADKLRRRLLHGLNVTSTGEALEELLETLTNSFAEQVARLGDQVDDAEDKILVGQLHDQGAQLGRMRRLLARLRRHARSNRTALSAALPRLPLWLEDERRRHLAEVADRMEAVAQDIELIQERTRLLQEEIAGRLNEATNANLFFLSIITATLLPVTLITGIFGMNVGGLPWLNDPGGFRWVALIMVASVAGVLLLLRRRRIF